MTPAVTVASFGHDDPRFRQVAAIRRRVFVEEQATPEVEEWDDNDPLCVHCLADIGGTPAGTLRWWDDGGWFHLGRLAVLGEFRGRGVAKALLRAGLAEGRARGFGRSFLNAQVDKVELYRSFGFHPVGEEFYDGPILHRRMEAALTK